MFIFFRSSNLLDAPVSRKTWCCPKETPGHPSHQLVSQCRRRQASEARQGQGRRRIAPSLRDPAMPTYVHGSWSACSTVPMDVDGTPRDSSASSRRCAICTRVGSPHWMRCSVVAFPVAPCRRCFWSLCLDCPCT